ncbi:putative RING-H2 finger protein ATL53 [Rhodamnia argentea]|uniref:RING-type E3 ubiquitin transferase n=1 Tax=Rhodamnia argentea TaxID=178133 RepID=A0A8B8MVA7_9MYRT|nr:putative RING-H2 finger protein ATL53 [Rhodamnia argentea]
MNSHGGNTSSSSNPTSPGSLLTPLLLSMTGIVATAFAVVAYHVFFVRFCARRQRFTADDDPLGERENSRAKTDGVDEKVLRAIPVLSYSSKGNRLFRVDQSECAVCLGILEDRETVRLLPACRHAFHVPCIDQWLSAHNNCPICRSPVVAPPTRMADDHSATNAASCNNGGDIEASDGPPLTSDLLQLRVSLNVLRRSPSDSANQSRDMVINVEEEREDASGSSSNDDLTSSLLGKGVVLSNSMSLGVESRQLDGLSSRLLRSFSQLSSSRRVDANLPR